MSSKIFRILLTVEIILLFIQFWIGMSINLFFIVPLHSAQNFAGYAGGNYVLEHIINGVTALALAGFILSYGSRLRSRLISILSILAMVFALVAVSTGATFALRLRDDSLSMAMAVSFLIIFAAYFSEFYLVERIQALSSNVSKTLEK
jgi:hypothetical protein